MPAGVERGAVLALARADLVAAGEYTRALQSGAAPRGLVAFCALPVLLAQQSLDRVEARGSGAKLTRGEVQATVAALDAALERGEPVIR